MILTKDINFNNFLSFEHLIIYLGLPLILILLIIKAAILLTINFQKSYYHQNEQFSKGKIIIIQLILWLITQLLLLFIPIEQLKVNINLFIFKVLPVLSVISLLHLWICFSFIAYKNNSLIIALRFSAFAFIILGLISQFSFTLIVIAADWFNSFMTWILIIFIDYLFIFLTFKMFNDSFLTFKILIIKTAKTLIQKTATTTILQNQKQFYQYQQKINYILLMWNFDYQKSNFLAKIDQQVNTSHHLENIKLLQKTIRQNLKMLLSSWLTICCKKILKDIKTEINGWKIKQLQ